MAYRPYQSQSGDPRWITAKYNGHDGSGKRFKRGERVLYFPRTKTIFAAGPEADREWAAFTSAAADEAFQNGGSY